MNTLTWSHHLLCSGSDDREVKIWNLDPNTQGGDVLRVPIHSVHTMHNNNIFCAELCPSDLNLLVSGSADGTVVLNYLNRSSAQRCLHRCDGCVHKVAYDNVDPMVVYIADESGSISRVDIRTNSPSEAIFTRHNRLPIAERRHRMDDHLSTKAMVQFSANSNHILLGGDGFDILLMDFRVNSVQERDVIVQKWNPTFPYGGTGICALSPLRLQNTKAQSGVSITGLRLSKDEQTILGSYHKEQIYLFDVADGCSPDVEAGMETSGGARQCLGGHLNEKTFLKDVAFFGPSDDYVVSGCDSGMMWIWDAKSGYIESCAYSTPLLPLPAYKPTSSRPCRVVAIHEADNHICNGVIPHPYLPILASYGIDKEIKLWNWNDEDDVEDNDDDGDIDNDAMTGETRTKTIRRCARSLKEYTPNRPSMEYIIDNLLEIHLIQCCSMKDGLYDRRTNLTDDFHNDHNASRIFQRCDFIRDDHNFIGPKNWDLILGYYLKQREINQDNEHDDDHEEDGEDDEYGDYTHVIRRWRGEDLPSGVRKAFISSWNNGKIYDIERFRYTLWDIRVTNSTSYSSSSTSSLSPSSSSLVPVKIGEKRDRGFSPFPSMSIASKDTMDQEKQSTEPEKDLVQLVRMEVEKNKAIEEQENQELMATPMFPSDFATIMYVSRPGFPANFSPCNFLMKDQCSSSSSPPESSRYSWENLISRNMQKHHSPQIPYDWQRIKRFLDGEQPFIDSFKERLCGQFPFRQCGEQIEKLFNNLDENFVDISSHLSDDIRMMFYIYQIAAVAKEKGTSIFGEDREGAVREYYKADKYLQLLSRDILDRLVIWEMSFCDKPQDSIKRVSLNPDGSSINNCESDPSLIGLRRSFMSLVDVHRYFSPHAYSTVVSDMCQANVDNYLPIAHEYFRSFLYKSIGALLLHILHKKVMLLAITVKSNIAAYAVKTKRMLLCINHSTAGILMNKYSVVNEFFLKSLSKETDTPSLSYTIAASCGMIHDTHTAGESFRLVFFSLFFTSFRGP